MPRWVGADNTGPRPLVYLSQLELTRESKRVLPSLYPLGIVVLRTVVFITPVIFSVTLGRITLYRRYRP